jgi:hypothetical protein
VGQVAPVPGLGEPAEADPDADPTAPALSPRVFASPLWGTQVRAVEVLWAGDPWLIVWRIRPDGSPSIACLGPAPARI